MMRHLKSILAQTAPPDLNGENLTTAAVIALSGILIVFVALILISVFISLLPHVLALVGQRWPEVDDHHAVEHIEQQPEDELAILAAIGFVLHWEFQRQVGGDSPAKSPS